MTGASIDPSPRVAVVGPTASAKSAVAMAVAERLGDVDLVSVDSMQVYRRMDIGTAKPTPADRERVRHHLLDLVEPDQEFTVAEFQRAFRSVVDHVEAAGRRVLLVGGTGLYHRAVVDGLDLPGEWPEIRRHLEGELAEVGPEILHARLSQLDPEAASRMEPTNARRIVRALEVVRGSGRPFSSFGPGLDRYQPNSVVQVGIRWDRSVLAARIEQRVLAMVDEGLVAEVASILDDCGFSRTAAQALGYKEVIDHLEGRCGLDEAVAMIVTRTRQFAVRQLRWFQRDPRVRWVDIAPGSGTDPVAAVLPVVEAAFG